MSIVLRHYNRRKDLDDALAIEEFRTVDLCYRIESMFHECRSLLGMPCGNRPEKPLMPIRVSEYEHRGGECIELRRLCDDMIWVWDAGRRCAHPRYEVERAAA